MNLRGEADELNLASGVPREWRRSIKCAERMQLCGNGQVQIRHALAHPRQIQDLIVFTIRASTSRCQNLRRSLDSSLTTEDSVLLRLFPAGLVFQHLAEVVVLA